MLHEAQRNHYWNVRVMLLECIREKVLFSTIFCMLERGQDDPQVVVPLILILLITGYYVSQLLKKTKINILGTFNVKIISVL